MPTWKDGDMKPNLSTVSKDGAEKFLKSGFTPGPSFLKQSNDHFPPEQVYQSKVVAGLVSS